MPLSKRPPSHNIPPTCTRNCKRLIYDALRDLRASTATIAMRIATIAIITPIATIPQKHPMPSRKKAAAIKIIQVRNLPMTKAATK